MPSKKNLLSFLFLTVRLILCLQINQSVFAQKLELVVQTEEDIHNSAAFSPNGKILAISGSGNDFTIKLWNLETGLQIRSLKAHTNSVSALAFLPDGKSLVSAGYDGTIKLWNVDTGRLLKTLSRFSVDTINEVKISPDGKLLAFSANENDTIEIFHIETGQKIKSLQDKVSLTSPIAFSPDGKVLISGIEGQKIKFWDLKTWKESK